MKKIPKLECGCERSGQSAEDYRTSKIGTDHTDDRNAEVSILQCKLCQRIWLKYFVEFESFTKSGRWYKGIITKKDVAGIKPENAVEYLENLDWYIYGGSYFESTGMFGQGKLM